jgi:hypothetical protein
MSDSTHFDSSRATDRHQVWRSIVVPTAGAVVGFLWRVAWFSLFIWILFHSRV